MSDERHLANVIGAFALDVETRVQAAIRRSSGLALVEAGALSALANLGADGLSIEQLRGLVDLSQSATVRLVDRLVALGLVRRRTSAGDRRVTLVQLTASGRAMAAKMRRARLDVLTDWVSTLTAEQRASLKPLADVLVARDLEPTPAGGTGADYRCRWCDPAACGHPDGCPVTAAVRG